MTRAADDDGVRPQPFAARRAAPQGVKVPDPRRVLAAELDKIAARVEKVRAAGRDQFRDGEPAYDIGSIAIQRLAALFEDEVRLGPLVSAVAADEERKGIVATRNYTAHVGYTAMNDDVFWHTITVDVPAFIAKVRTAHAL